MKKSWSLTTSRTNSSWGNALIARAEVFSKLAAIGIIVVYLSGFGVQTLWLARYHVGSLSLLRAQNILAGLWILSPLLFGPFGEALRLKVVSWFPTCILGYLRKPDMTGWNRLWQWLIRAALSILSVLIVSFCTTFAIGFLLPVILQLGPEQFGPISNPDLYTFAISTGIFASLITILGIRFHAAVDRLIECSKWDTDTQANHGYSALRNGFFLLLMVLSYIGFFTLIIFPRIPLALGGGKFPTVRFLWTVPLTMPATTVSASALDFSRSKSYTLLLETAEAYIVRDPKGTDRWATIKFNRELVAGYEIDYPRQTWEVGHSVQSTSPATATSQSATSPKP